MNMAKRRRKRGPLPFQYVFLATFIIFTLFTFQGLWIINKGIKPTLINIAETKTKQFATMAIQAAVNKRINDDLDSEQIVTIEKDDQGNIASIGWNSKVVNRVLRQSTERVQLYLQNIEAGTVPPPGTPPGVEIEMEDGSIAGSPIIEYIPLGEATNNVLLANLGPKVPVRFNIIGNVKSDVVKKISEFGINNSMIEISVHMDVNMRVVIPFATETVSVSTDIPIDVRVINGEVPYFYNGGGGGDMTPSFEAPGM
jgi:sporulation protein YunB